MNIIKIKFNSLPVVNETLTFTYYGETMTQTESIQFKTNRLFAGQSTIGSNTTSTATNFKTAFDIDYNNDQFYTSTSGNEVTIETKNFLPIWVSEVSGVTYSYTVTSATSSLLNSEIVLAGNDVPVHITYNATASLFDYCLVDLYLWNGSISNSSSATNYTLPVYKSSTTNGFVYVDAGDYISDFIEPYLNMNWLLDVMGDFGECCWFKYKIRSYKIVDGSGVLYETLNSRTKLATLGYYFNGEPSYPPSTTLVDPIDKFSTENTNNYLTKINPFGTNTSNVISRTKIDTNHVIYSGEHREWQVVYLNKYGVWDSMLFNRKSTKSLNITSDKYQSYQTRPDIFNISAATNRIQSLNAKEEWTLNTDLLNENQNKYMEELFLSTRMYLMNIQTNQLFPVIITDKKFDEKLTLYDRVKIQWTVKFESANNKINDIK